MRRSTSRPGRLERLVLWALRPTSNGFYARFIHYVPKLLRGEWPGRLRMRRPRTLSEKILYQRFHVEDLIPDIALFADKLRVRDYVAATVGPQHLVPLLGTWSQAEDISWPDLPERFALKANHGAGLNLLVSDRTRLDTAASSRIASAWLETDFSRTHRSPQYRAIPPAIFAEHLLGSVTSPWDYKMWCFHGTCHLIEVDVDRHSDHRQAFFDREWNRLPIEFEVVGPAVDVPRPANLEVLISVAERLASPFALVSVDLYDVDGVVYFGEFTFTPGAGMTRFLPREWDRRLGDLVDLSSRRAQGDGIALGEPGTFLGGTEPHNGIEAN